MLNQPISNETVLYEFKKFVKLCDNNSRRLMEKVIASGHNINFTIACWKCNAFLRIHRQNNQDKIKESASQ